MGVLRNCTHVLLPSCQSSAHSDLSWWSMFPPLRAGSRTPLVIGCSPGIGAYWRVQGTVVAFAESGISKSAVGNSTASLLVIPRSPVLCIPLWLGPYWQFPVSLGPATRVHLSPHHPFSPTSLCSSVCVPSRTARTFPNRACCQASTACNIITAAPALPPSMKGIVQWVGCFQDTKCGTLHLVGPGFPFPH